MRKTPEGIIKLNAASLRRLTELAFTAAGAQQVAAIAASAAAQAEQRLRDTLGSLVETSGGDPAVNWTIDFERSELRRTAQDAPAGRENGAKETGVTH